MARPFIFNGGDPGETPESVARRRQIADALLQQSLGYRRPQSVMEAIGQGFDELGSVLAERRINNRADQAEAAGRASVGDLSGLFGGDDGGGTVATAPAGGSGASGATAGSTPTNAKDLANEFIGLGYSPTQAAGIVGNLVQESGLNPSIPGDSGISHGLGQWNGDRFAALKQFAAANGSQWTDPKVQVRFIDHELKSSEGQAYKRLMAAQTPEQAAAAFIGYERPRGFTWDNPAGGHGYANRVAHASRIAQMLGTSQPTQVASLDPSAGMDKAYPNTWDAPPVPGATPQPYTSPMQGSDNDPTGLGQGQPMPPIQRVTQALQQAQGGGPAPANPAVQRVAQAMSQRARTALGILQNPWASDGQKAVASAVLKQEMEQSDPAYQLGLRKSQLELEQLEHPAPKYGFTSVGDNLIRTDDAGNAIPVYQGQPKATGKEQDYEYYAAQEKAQGRQPLSFGEWDVRNTKAGSSSVTVNNAGTTELQKLFAKRYDDISTQAQGAPDAIAKLDRMTVLSKDPNFYSGTGAGTVQFFKQALAALGGDPKSAAPMEEFAALSNKAALDVMGGSLGTGFSNADRDFVVATVPALDATPQGNLQRIDVLRRINRRKIEIGKMADDYVMQNGQLDAGFNKLLSQYAETHPLFGDLSGQSGSQPQAPAAPASSDGWKVLPNGVRIRVKP